MDTVYVVSSSARLHGPVRPDLLRAETLFEVFRSTAAAHPDKTAVQLIGGGHALAYRALLEQAERLARSLAAQGVRRGDLVGLWLPRSIELHVGLLGILAAGAAYIPFDFGVPVDRVSTSLADGGARVLLTHGATSEAAAGMTGVRVFDVAELLGPDAAQAEPDRATQDDRAYVIYTSGSTGKPKGIEVSHRNICHYLRAGNEVLGITTGDVVLQQASIAFDLSLEEIFVPYSVGATLKVATAEMLARTDRLIDLLDAEAITVVDTVPTLLSLFDRDPATVRLIIVGGEACPPSIVERFARPGRRIVNSYGPTEATVVATAGELVPGEPVTIGRPIPNASAYVVDERLQLVGPGEIGELLIGGPGVVPGYVGLPDLTASKFIANPFKSATGMDPVLYRSGDAVAIDAEGRLTFHGRLDGQVKVRGYRIEIGEIEETIRRTATVSNVAVVVQKVGAAGDALVAHVVPGHGFETDLARRALLDELPAYMVPQLWRKHDRLPVLPSGKTDRKALAALPLEAPAATEPQVQPSTLTEAHLLKAAYDAMGFATIDLDADFFDDLGGHSLIAATFISEVRKVPHLAGIALQDVYNHRTLRRMAAALDECLQAGPAQQEDLSFEPPPLMRRFACGLAQAVALPFIIALVTAQWIGLLLASVYLVRDNAPLWLEVVVLCGVFVAINLGAKVLVVVLKRLVIGRIEPGVYPLWGAQYFRIWLMQRIVQMTAHKFLQASPLMGIYLRLLGADIGRDAVIAEFEEGTIDLISIGPRASTGQKVRFANVEVIGNEVHVGRISIGADAYIGNAVVIAGDVEIGDRAEIADLTAIAAGTRVGAGERWDGAPGKHVGMAEPSRLPPHPEIGPIARTIRVGQYFVAYNLMMIVGLLPIFPAFFVLSYLDGVTFGERDHVVPWQWVFLLAWPAAFALIMVSMAVIVIMRWTLFPQRVQPGRHSIHSAFYFRKWMMGLATEAVLETLNSLYATVFMRNWYRLMGTKVGRGTEISSNFSGRYDLIELGENNFLGDEVIIGDEDVRGGWMQLDRVKTGDLCFVGNLAVVDKGAVIEDGALIGVKSKLPDGLHVKAHETWFGSPAFALPNRQKVILGQNRTYLPPWNMRLLRTVFEALHSSLPTAMLIAFAYITADIIEFPINNGDYWTALAIFMSAGLIIAALMVGMSLAVKWLMMGVYRPCMKPMWSWWAMRTEAVAVLYGGLASKALLEYLRGTPFLPWTLRLYGTQIGKGTWINSTDLTEFDCVKINDFAVINMLASPQTHLYEDRIMKVGKIEIGKGATIGTAGIVLYDSHIGEFARLAPLTVVMKGENIPSNSRWSGAPACREGARTVAVANSDDAQPVRDKPSASAA